MFLSGISTAMGTGQASATDDNKLNANFDTFLQLLTTQLQNQNPTDPLDANEFTKQLVQYSSVEQEIKSNKNLESLIQLQSVNAATAATSFLGKSITVQSASTSLANGEANWRYTSEGSANSAVFTVTNEAGEVMYEEIRDLETGPGKFAWNGYTSTGSKAPDGFYALKIEARDPNGNTVPVTTMVSAKIDGVDFSGSEPVLLAGDRGVKLGDVTSVVDS